MNSQRRNFICTTGAIAVALLMQRLPAMRAMSESAHPGTGLLARMLEAMHHTPQLATTVDSDALSTLLARILGISADELEQYASLTAEQLRQRIHDNMAEDYRQRHVRVIDGWWLSETEVGCLELLERVA
jgi:hypothetical protein